MSANRLFQLLFLVVLVTLTALPVFAANRYTSIISGVWLPHETSTIGYNLEPISTSYSPGWILGTTYGFLLDNGLRIENELIYRRAEAKHSKSDQWNLGLLVNVWWEGKHNTPIAPYFGGGAGYARAHVASPGMVNNSGGGMAYQAGGGIVFSQKAFDVDLGYRYFGISGTTGNISSVDLIGSSWLIGVRKKF